MSILFNKLDSFVFHICGRQTQDTWRAQCLIFIEYRNRSCGSAVRILDLKRQTTEGKALVDQLIKAAQVLNVDNVAGGK